MATPNIVPRADQEGGLGTAAKSWGKLFINQAASQSTSALSVENSTVAQPAVTIADVGIRPINIVQAYATTTASTTAGVYIDIDKTETSTTNNTMNGIYLDMDSAAATSGTNTMYGIYCTPTLTHAADAGTPTVKGGYFEVTGHTNGAATAYGLQVTTTGADTNIGIESRTAAGDKQLVLSQTTDADDNFSISVAAAGATTITTVDDAAAAAHLTFDIDGDIIIGGDADGTDRSIVFGHSTIKTRMGIDDSSDAFVINTDAAFDATLANNSFSIDASHNAIIAGNISSTTYKTMWVGAGEMIPNETDGAQAVTEETATRNVMIDAMAFDKDADEHVYFTKVMPRQWNGGTVKFKFYWKPTSTDTGTAQFSISANSYVSDDNIDVSFSGDVTNTALAASGTATDLMITAATGALTIGGSPTQAEECLIQFRLFRDVSGDTFNGDVHLIGVLIQYQEGTGIVTAW